MRETMSFDSLVPRWFERAIRKLAYLRGAVIQHENGNGPRQKHNAAYGEEGIAEGVLLGERLNEPGPGGANQGHADIDNSHCHAAIFSVPVRHDDLVWDGT